MRRGLCTHTRKHAPPLLVRFCLPGRGKSFRLRLPALLALAGSKQSLPPDEPDEAVVVDLSKPSSESMALDEVTSSLEPPGLGCEEEEEEPEDRRALMERRAEAGEDPLVTHSSPRTEKATHLHLEASFSNCSLSRTRSHESFYSVRRASSVDDIEAMKGEGEKGWAHSRHASTGGWPWQGGRALAGSWSGGGNVVGGGGRHHREHSEGPPGGHPVQLPAQNGRHLTQA